jgi:hypothetical protein
MNRPVAERGPNVSSEIAQPQTMTISGVRHAHDETPDDETPDDETPDARIALSDITLFPGTLRLVPRRTRNIGMRRDPP